MSGCPSRRGFSWGSNIQPIWPLLLALTLLLLPILSAHATPSISGGCPASRSGSLAPFAKLRFAAITYCDHGDLDKIQIILRLSRRDLRRYDLYSAGYSNGRDIRIQIRNDDGEVRDITPPPAGERWRLMAIRIPSRWHDPAEITVVLTDNSAAWRGWAGIGLAKKNLFAVSAQHYLAFGLKALLAIVATLLPGLWLREASARALPLGLVLLPGLLFWSAAGLLFWISPQAGWLARGAWPVLALLAADWLRRLRKRDAPSDRNEIFVLGVFGLVFLQALVIGVTPLPVFQEFAPQSNIPARMIASPPDDLIPYQTALYMHAGFKGREHRQEYFGEWNVASRGPLVSLGANGLFHLLREDGDLFRVYGWLLNAQIVLVMYQLLTALGVSGRRLRQGLVWTALAPAVIVNVVFLWPKLLAASFVLLSIAAIVQKRPAWAGVFAALAWLSHPVGALMVPALGVFALTEPAMARTLPGGFKRGVRSAAILAVAFAVIMAPWLIYKHVLAFPADSFMDYPLGDGRGTLHALSVKSWLLARRTSIEMTLVPAAFYFSDFMHQWIYGPIPDYLRWSIQYAKTLPGELGFVCYPLAIVAIVWPQRQARSRAFKYCLLIFAFAVEIIFWGYSSDGLGRNCLEPITLLCIAYTLQADSPAPRWLGAVLPVLAAEGLYLIWSGYTGPGNGFPTIKYDGWLCLVLNAAIDSLLLWAAFRSGESAGKARGSASFCEQKEAKKLQLIAVPEAQETVHRGCAAEASRRGGGSPGSVPRSATEVFLLLFLQKKEDSSLPGKNLHFPSTYAFFFKALASSTCQATSAGAPMIRSRARRIRESASDKCAGSPNRLPTAT